MMANGELFCDIDFTSLAKFKASLRRIELSNCLTYCIG